MLIQFMQHLITFSNLIQLNIGYQINIAYSFPICKVHEL